ncbi:methyltransferase domain-containing protein [Actinomadura scrupuli]|uniref:methyltransferase domain-containing protein n=1 Tax=Actinomadura scrupuli TaxID=559629 RepID=UPI003D9632A5
MTGEDRPRWLLLGEVPTAARVLHETYGGGPYWRHLVKALTTPHLTVPGRSLVLGVEPFPCDGVRHRVGEAALHVLWLVLGGARGRDTLPWVLRASGTETWRLVNLARSPGDRAAARLTAALGGFALALADRYGIALRAEAARENVRLSRIYRLRGFEIVGETPGDLLLRRPPVTRPASLRPPWRRVLRTGRVGGEAWQRRFGAVHGPLLDVGSGDSPLTIDVAADGIAAVALDPQFSLRAPARAAGAALQAAAVAGLGEALPFRTEVFAVVTAGHALQHVGPVRRALLESLRVARRDGLVVIHPAWGGRRRLRRLARLEGVRVLPGRWLPPHRQRSSLVIDRATFDPAAGLDLVERAARPNRYARILGAITMRALIRARGTTAVGPGAAR